MNVTLTELILLCWAVLATGAAITAFGKAHHLIRFIHFILEEPDAYREVKKRHDAFVASRRERRT